MKTNKYKVSQELMNEIDEWRYRANGLVFSQDLMVSSFVDGTSAVKDWWLDNAKGVSEKNNRLIALIKYVNGEDVFEVEKPKKWIVRSKSMDVNHQYQFLTLYDENHYWLFGSLADKNVFGFGSVKFITQATRFNTKEEAEKWANPLMEAEEVEDD